MLSARQAHKHDAMQTQIHAISEVTCTLEIEAAAEDIAPDFNAALRQRRDRTDMKGFRAGKVPLHLIKRIHGKELASLVAHNKVMETFHTEVIEKGQYDVVGRPALTSMEHEMDGGLRAVVRFGVRPEIALKDLSGEKLHRLTFEVSDEEVDQRMEWLRKKHADLVPVEGEEITEDFQVLMDSQRLDEATNVPVVGEKQEDIVFFVDDERLEKTLREAVLGKRVGDTCVVELPSGENADGPVQRYRIWIRETRRRDLPDFDDSFVQRITEGEFPSADTWKSAVRQRLAQAKKDNTEGLLAEHIVERMLDLHDIPVPESAVDLHLDDFFDDFVKRCDGKLPEDFNLLTYREENRSLAARHAKWGLLRDAWVEQEKIEVTEDDLDAWFDKAVEGHEDISSEMLRRHYERNDGLDDIRGRILSRKVLDTLIDAFEIEDTGLEDFRKLYPGPSAQDSSSILTPA